MIKYVCKTFRRRLSKETEVSMQLQHFLDENPKLKIVKTMYVAENLETFSDYNYEKENLMVIFSEEDCYEKNDDHPCKLIRDKIPEILRDKGVKFETEECLPELYVPFLRKKLEEEYNEFKNAKNTENAIEELADMIEVIFALAREFGCTEKVLEDMRLRKKEERGGFEKLLILDSIERDDKN